MATRFNAGKNDQISPSSDTSQSSRDLQEILSDMDQTSMRSSPEDDLRGGGPVSLDLEDEPAEFVRGEIDVKTQMDRTTRIAKADALGHHDLDDSPDMTPGGLDEVAAKTDEDLARKGRGRPERPAVPENDPGETRRSSARLDIDEIEEELDLASDGLSAGTMNEEDARESGYINDQARPRIPSRAPQQGHPTGAYTDIGAGRSSVVHGRDDSKERRPH
ncbi:MAG: hypothetical protein KF802_10730 [Bdellovibrionaceae bacterium]|nr:hypothetical protein [Pseudobdellovibrionaceae bacterium]MBX3034613.1 hypothetical protein [Pseudobdellovibrionaceae bacterium]